MPRVTLRGFGGLGQDDSDLADFASGSGTDYVDTSALPIGPALPSGAFTTATATPSDIAWAQSNEQYESTSFAPSGVTSYGTSSPTSNPFAQSTALATPSLTSALTSALTAPSPRIATVASAYSPLTSSTLIPGIPDIVTIGGLGLILVLAASGGKKR